MRLSAAISGDPMSLKTHFDLLAGYNRWMNAGIYDAAARLDAESLARDRGAFFHSILGTLNHIVVGDTIWLKRYALHADFAPALAEVVAQPDPQRLDQILFADLAELCAHREWLDGQISGFVGGLSEADFATVVSFRSMAGVPSSKQLSHLLLHFFNHQTHHRGQVTTLLSQAGVDPGPTDLLLRVPELHRE
jgi:uncharacterized damage-inducible protein DinB